MKQFAEVKASGRFVDDSARHNLACLLMLDLKTNEDVSIGSKSPTAAWRFWLKWGKFRSMKM